MATYYWVGGNGTWDNANTTNWSASSGGAGGSGPPLAADTAIFDLLSGGGTCTTATGATCAACTLNSTTALSLGAPLTLTGQFSLLGGTLTLNSYKLTIGTFASTNSVTFNFNTGSVDVTGIGFVWSWASTDAVTITGTPTVNFTNASVSGTRSIRQGNSAGGTEARAININITAGTDAISVITRVKNLDFTGFSGSWTNQGATIHGNLVISSGMTVGATATPLTFAATSGTQQITTNGKTIDLPLTQNSPGATVQLQDNLTMGSTRTFTLTNGALDLNNLTLSTGLFSSSNSNTRAIAFGTGNITTTGSGTVWTTATPTNFSRTGTPTVNISNNSATATTVSTGTMTEAQSLNFNYTTGTYTLTDTAAVYRSVNFTGFAGTIPNSVRTIFGSLTLSTGMTLTAGTNATTFASTAAGNTITSNGKTLDFPVTFNGIGGTFAFQDALTQGSTQAFTITNGTVQLKDGVTSTVGSFVANNTAVKFLQSTTLGSQATLSQASGTVNVADLTIRDINAVGGASWNAYTDFENTDAGNNDGWNFSLSPPYSVAELPITLRPFTQPRRF